MDTKKATTCNCLIKHALTSAERSDVSARLNEARELRDTVGITLALIALSPCPSAK